MDWNTNNAEPERWFIDEEINWNEVQENEFEDVSNDDLDDKSEQLQEDIGGVLDDHDLFDEFMLLLQIERELARREV